jgi:receptor expression-enhancing protein 5/6
MLSFGISWALSYFVATAYPTYQSYKALGTASSADDTQWLTYWVTYSVLTTVEAIATSFIVWFPLYYEIRLLFVLWLVLPQSKGAQVIFENYIKPMMKHYGASIDPTFAQAEKVMNSQQVHQIVKLSETYGPAIAQQALQRAAEEAQRLAGSGAGKASAGGSNGASFPPAYKAPQTQAPPGYRQNF